MKKKFYLFTKIYSHLLRSFFLHYLNVTMNQSTFSSVTKCDNGEAQILARSQRMSFQCFWRGKANFPSKNPSLKSCINEIHSNAWHLTMLIISSRLTRNSLFQCPKEITHMNCNPFSTWYFHKTWGFVLSVWLLWRHFNFIWHDFLKWMKWAQKQLAADCLF